MIDQFLPTGLEPFHVLVLVGLSFVTSLITATFSLGGGTLMLAILALVFPPAVVVPVHGFIQLGSNGGRAIVQRAHIQWHLILWISLGALVGTTLGGQFVAVLPEHLFTIAIGVFVLVTTWLPQPAFVAENRPLQFIGGAIISALSMVVGATGPLLATLIRGLADRRDLVATHAMLMTLLHGFKVVVFVALGFAFGSYLPLMLIMIVAGFAGTALGSHLLVRVPEKLFRIGFKLILTLVALDLIRGAIFPATPL